MKLWITGAGGFVAKALQNLCKKEGIDYIATPHEQVDITSLQEIKKFLKNLEGRAITHLVNCAAYTDVDKAEQEPEAAYQVNTAGPAILGEIARQHELNMLHLSTDYVFGSNENHPFTETAPCSPVSVYAKTKFEGEKGLLDAYPQACILRTSWVFGQGGRNFVSSLFKKIQNEEKIYVTSDQRNRLTYVADLAGTMLNLLCHSGIFHFANQGEISRFEVAKTLMENLRARGISVACRELIPITSSSCSQTAQRPLYSVLDTTKIEGVLGKTPRSWQVALKEFVDEI